MQQPKRTKYRKMFKGTNTGLAHRGSSVSFGEYGLRATSRARMTAREIEAARRAMTRYVKRGGQVWNRVFPDVPVSKKPLEVRMGAGKGNVEYWVAKVQPGKVLFEIEGVDEATAREAFRLASAKLSVSTMFVKRQGALMTQKNRKLVEQLRGKDETSLRQDLIKLRREQFSLRMQASSGQTVKSSDFGKVKKNIARLKTISRAKQLSKAAGAK